QDSRGLAWSGAGRSPEAPDLLTGDALGPEPRIHVMPKLSHPLISRWPVPDDPTGVFGAVRSGHPRGGARADPHDDATPACAPRRDRGQPRGHTRLAGGGLWALDAGSRDLENVWALAVWRSANEEPGERPQR